MTGFLLLEATTSPTSLLISEEECRRFPKDQLDFLLTKIIELCIPQPIDRTAKEAQLNVRKESYESDLEVTPILKHELGLPYMISEARR